MNGRITFVVWIIAAVTVALAVLSALYLRARTQDMPGVTADTFWPIGWITIGVFATIGLVMGIFIVMVLRKNAELDKGE